MAEAVFLDLVKKEGLSGKIEVDSSGTGDWHVGKVPHQGTRKILDEKNISYEGIVARKVQEKDWDDFDYIIAMDEQNIEDLKNIRAENDTVVIRKLMDFVEQSDVTDVPDPYYTGNFEYTYALVSEGCKQLLNYIKKEHSLT